MNKKRQPHLPARLIAFFVACFAVSGHAAVTSIGEINVKDDDQGLVPAGSTVTLIITLRIDRSLAKPVDEDIKTIEIILPSGFVVEPSNFKSFSPRRSTNRCRARALRESPTYSLRRTNHGS